MSRPAISIPPLPPNFFFHITFAALVLSNTALAIPIPKGSGGSGGGGHGSGGHGSGSGSRTSAVGVGGGSSSSNHENKPLSTKTIVAIVLGTVFGTLFVVCVAVMCTNIDYCTKKEIQFRTWFARKRGKDTTYGSNVPGLESEKELGESDSESVESGLEERSEWDRVTSVDDEEDDGDDEKASAGERELKKCKAGVVAYSDSVSEVTHIDEVGIDRSAIVAAALPEVLSDGNEEKRSWRDRLTRR